MLAFGAIALAFLLCALLAVMPVVSPAEWADEFGPLEKWQKVSGGAMVLAALSIAIMVNGVGLDDVWKLFASITAAGISSVVFAYSLLTDFQLRKVDRRLLNRASLITLFTSGGYLFTHWNPVTAVAAGIMIFFGVFVYVFVHSIGASDARVMIFLGTGVIPVVGYYEFMWSIIGVGVLFILLGAAVAIVKKNMRVSFPAVPMLLGPFWIVLLISGYTTLGAVTVYS